MHAASRLAVRLPGRPWLLAAFERVYRFQYPRRSTAESLYTGYECGSLWRRSPLR